MACMRWEAAGIILISPSPRASDLHASVSPQPALTLTDQEPPANHLTEFANCLDCAVWYDFAHRRGASPHMFTRTHRGDSLSFLSPLLPMTCIFARLSVVSGGAEAHCPPAGRSSAGDARGSVRELLKERWIGSRVRSAGAVVGRLVPDGVACQCVLTGTLRHNATARLATVS